MDLAALAALREPVELTIGGLLYEVAPADVQAWVRSLAEPIRLLPLLDFEVAVRLSDRLYNDEVDLADLLDAWREALAAQTGQPWWAAERLLAVVAGQWEAFAGELVLRGQDPLHLPVDLAVAVAWTLVQRSLAGDELQLMKAQHDVWTPPASEVEQDAPLWTDEEEGAAWLAAAGAAGAQRPSATAPARLGSG